MTGRIVHLMRHGMPRRPGLMLGHTDEPAADPAAGLNISLPEGLCVTSVTSSDLSRALVGAHRIAASRGLTTRPDPRWRELDFGQWDGRAPQDLPAGGLARFWDDPDGYPPPGGEGWASLRQRVGEALADAEDGALVVTHAGAMRAAVSVITNLDHRQVWAFDLPYGALLSLRIWQGESTTGQIVGLLGGAGQ